MKKDILFSNGAQGTIEYLVIIGIVVVISLVVVGVLVGQTSSATNVSTTSSKISSLVGEISLIDSGVTPDGNRLVSLKSNIVGAITITNVKIGDFNKDFSEQLNQNSLQNFIVPSTSCTLGEKNTYDVTITYSDQYGLSHTKKYPSAVSFTCEEYTVTSAAGQVNPPVVPPQTGGGDTTAPTIFLISPASNLSFNTTVDFNFLASDNNAISRCVLRIDGVDRNSWARIDTNTYNVLKFNISTLLESLHTWDVNCLDYNSNWGTYGGTDWNIVYDIVSGRNVYFTTAMDFNAGDFSTFATNFSSIKPQGEMDWNSNDLGVELDTIGALSSGLINVWHLNSSSTDSVGANNGTWSGSSSYTLGKWGTQAGNFTGSNYLSLASEITAQTNMTYSFLAKMNYNAGFSYAPFGKTGTVCYILFNSDNRVYLGNCAGTQIYWAYSDFSNWHHYVVKKTGTTVELFIDGISQGSQTLSTVTPIAQIGSGQNVGGNNNFNGIIEDLAIWNRSLSSNEINTLYKSYKGTWLDNNLVAYFKFNDKNSTGNGVYDSARTNMGTIVSGADTNAQGLWDSNALYLNGTTGYVKVSSFNAFSGNSDHTLMTWVKILTIPTAGTDTPFIWYGGNSTRTVTELGLKGSYFASIHYNDDLTFTSFTPKANTWYHVAVVYNSSSRLGTLYVNGRQQESGTYAANLSLSTGGLAIGGDTANTRKFNGILDEVKVYNKQLSATEIQADYNRGLLDSNYVSRILDTNSGYIGINGTDYNYLLLNTNTGTDKNGHIYGTQIEPTIEKDLNNGLIALWHFNGNALDSSVFGRNATVTGATSTTGKFLQGYAITNGQYITPPSGTAPTGAITISEWFKISGSAFALYDFGVTSGCYPSNQYFMVDSNKLYWQIGCGNLFYGNTTIPYNTWQHAVVTVDGSNNVKLYLNGKLDGSGTRNIAAALGNDQIGASYSGGVLYTVSQGAVDEVAMWNRALSSDEVKELFNKGAARIGVKYRSCESSISCTRSWSDMNYLSGTNQISLNALDGNQYMQYALYPNLYPSPDGNYLPQAFATVRDVNLVYTN